MGDDPYRNVKERLKCMAQEAANKVGFGSFNVHQAEEDFLGYFNQYGSKKFKCLSVLPRLREINAVFYPKEIMTFIERMEHAGGISGFGNPYSPIIVAGAEWAHDAKPWDAYFKILCDFFWTNIIGKSNCCIKDRLAEFCFYWCGAEQNSPGDPLDWPFYKGLRSAIAHEDSLMKEYPYVVYLTLYHTLRQGGHYWGKLDKIKQCLIYDYENNYHDNRQNIFKNFNIDKEWEYDTHFKEYKAHYIPLEEYFFQTECNLIASRTSSKKHIENKFIEFILENYKQPRILLLNSAGNQNKLPKVVKEISFWNEFIQDSGNDKSKTANIKIKAARYDNGYCKHLLIHTSNLSSRNISNQFLFSFTQKIKEIAEGM